SVYRCGQVRLGGLSSPVEDLVDGAAMELDLCLLKAVTQSLLAGGKQLLCGGEVAQEVPGCVALPELGEACGQAGVSGPEMLADLAAEDGHLADDLATVPNEQLQGAPEVIQGLLGQSEAVDGGAMNGDNIDVVGLGVGLVGL